MFWMVKRGSCVCLDPLDVRFWFGGVFQFDDGTMEFSTAAIAFSSLVRFRLS